MESPKPQKIALSRQELYDLVWSTPMTRLASQFGISDQGLAKKCKQHKIPRPPQGHWQRLAAGHQIERTPLPPIEDASLEAIEILPSCYPQRSSADSEAIDNADPRLVAAREFQWPDKVTRYHPLVRDSRTYLKNQYTDRYGFLHQRYGDPPILDLKVTAGSSARAHQFMHGFLTLVEKIGWTCAIDDRNQQTYMEIDGERLHFQLKEAIQQTDHEPTKEEKLRDQRIGMRLSQRFDYIPTGRLSLRIESYLHGRVSRMRWSDTDKARIEDQLESIVVGFIHAAHAARQLRKEREAEERRREVERLERQRRQRNAGIEKAKRQHLIDKAHDWREAEDLFSFIEAVKRRKEDGTIPATPELDDWLTWAEDTALSLDPTGQFGSVLQEYLALR